MNNCSTSSTCGKVKMVSGIILGAIFVIFGLNKFFGFMPMAPMPELAETVMAAITASGLMTALGVLEVGVGVGLLLGLLVPLNIMAALAMSISFLVFHIFFAPTFMGILLPVVLILLCLGVICGTPKLKSALCCCNKSGKTKCCDTDSCTR